MVQRIYINVMTSDRRHYVFRQGEVNPKRAGYDYNTQCYYHFTHQTATGRRYPSGTGRTELQVGEPLMTAATYSTSDINRLYAKLVDKINGGAQGDLLTSAVEWRSSLDMITSRATQILATYNAVKRGQFGHAASMLGLAKHRRKSIERRLKKKRRLSPSEIWLEYWMGWAPMFGDIYTALDVIGRDRSRNHFTVGVTVKDTFTNYVGSKSSDLYRMERCVLSGRVSAYGNAQVTNHNLHIADQLGLINPARVAWNVVPFSFAIDWLLNVGQVLGSLTDFAGVTFSHTGQSRFIQRNSSKTGWDRVYDYTSGKYVREYMHVFGKQAEKVRVPGALPTPQLTVRFNRQSWTQAATSVSLLNEIFLKK